MTAVSALILGTVTNEEAWAAGLFDGEGSVGLSGNRERMQLKMVDEATVRRFHDAVDAGTVYGPYKNRTGEKDGYPRKDYFVWVADREDAAHVATLLYPLLSDVRREAIDRLDLFIPA